MTAVALGEIATGSALIAAPVAVATLLAGAPPSNAAIFLRWIGVFVLAVGTAYLTPRFAADGPERWSRLRGTLNVTTLARLLVAVFVAGSVAAGTLAAGWIVVGVYDGAIAVLQVALLARGAFGHGG
jgi:hypothetical protein